MRTWSTGNRAFTIVELIVVIVVVAVLATMIVPRLYGAAGTSRLKTSASRLLSAARYARSFAAARRRPCRLVLDLSEQRYVLSRIDDAEDEPGRFHPLRTGIGKAERLGQGLRFGKVWIRNGAADRSDGPTSHITFRPTGRADAAIVEVTDGRRIYSLLVAPHTARVELVKGAVREPPDDRVDLDE